MKGGDFMLLTGILALLVVFYLGLVSGSRKKLHNNGIYLNGKAKRLFPLVPLVIIGFHVLWAFKHLFKNPRFSLHLLKLAFLKYPLVLGLFIELALEEVAFNLSQDKTIVKVKRKKSVRNAVHKKGSVKLDDLERKKSRVLFREYINTVLPRTQTV
jgi:hypothetical protein